MRIEDTDQKRKVPGAVENLIETLNWSGINPDEGPNIPGNFGPYIQSERLELYKKHAQILIENEHAYYCFCTPERLAELRKQQIAEHKNTRYDNFCRELPQSEVKQNLKAKKPFVVRMKIPPEKTIEIKDLIHGVITFSSYQLDDQILMKSDGFPTYHLATVVDDHFMKISHIIRGEEWLSSTPKHQLLYNYFNWEIPKFAHLPLLLNPDRSKLSKRQGDVTVEDYRKQGYLPEALINFLALLGWNPGDEREFFTIEELIKEFQIERINKSAAIFSTEKLNWINAEHIRKLAPQNFHAIAQQYYPESILESYDTKKISPLIQPRIERLTDIPNILSFFINVLEYSPELYNHKKMKSTLGSSYDVLKKILPILENIDEWSNNNLYKKLVQFAKESNIKNGTVLWPLRIALSGQQNTPGGATEIAEILGKKETLRRIKDALNILFEESLSGKEQISTS